MPVPGRIAPGFTLGAALSYTTHERPCASWPVTTRRIGFNCNDILASDLFFNGSIVDYNHPLARKRFEKFSRDSISLTAGHSARRGRFCNGKNERLAIVRRSHTWLRRHACVLRTDDTHARARGNG